MRRVLFRLACLAALIAVAEPALAQRTTGDILGIVKDDSGAVLPGVTVTLNGEKIVPQSTTSSTAGFYRFPALPPGTYEATYTMSGFATLRLSNVKVSVGTTVEQDAVLKLSQLQEEITVTGESAVIDASSNEVATIYDKDWIRNAPLRRFTFFDLINAGPGVNNQTQTSSRSTALGSATDENSYQLDGTDFTAPYTGAAWPWPNTDAIEEIEVLSLGAPAEYGNLQGAVFNVVTRQGSNQFHGDTTFYYQAQGLTSNNTESITNRDGSFSDGCDEPDGRCPYTRDKYNDATIQLSGPIVKDKLWFFVSYQYQRDFQAPAGTPAQFPDLYAADRVFGKLNWQIGPRHKLQFAYHDDYYDIPVSAAAPALTAPTALRVEHGHNPSPNLTYTHIASDRTYFEARVSGFYGTDHADPQVSGEPRVKTRFNDLDTGAITGGIYYWYDGTSDKTAASFKVSHFADEWLGGSHDFKFGVQYNTGGHDYAYGYNDYIYTYSGVPAYGYYQLPFHQGGNTRTFGGFVDDTFRVSDRLTINAGLRFDNSRASFPEFPILDRQGNETGQTTAAVDDLFTWNSLSPRIGLSYRLTEDAKTVIKAHYGRYYRGIITGEFSRASPSFTPRFLFAGTYDAAGNPEGLEMLRDPSAQTIDGNFKNPYTDQFIASFERELRQDLGLQLTYTHKSAKNYGGWRDTAGVYNQVAFVDNVGFEPTGQTLTLLQLQNELLDRRFLLTNPDGMSTSSDSVIGQFTKRMSNNWQGVASVVWSKTTGRVGSSLSSTTIAQSGQAGSFGQNPNDFLNSDGLVTGDRTWTAKLQLVYNLPRGFMVGANYLYQTGRPWGRQLRVSRSTLIPFNNVLSEPLSDERRVASWNSLDLRLQKDFKFSDRAGLAFFVDLLNAFNDDAHQGVASRRADQSTYGDPTRFVFPRRLMLAARFHF